MGACVGHRGSRVQSVVNELYDEKIDIVRWNENIEKFIGGGPVAGEVDIGNLR